MHMAYKHLLEYHYILCQFCTKSTQIKEAALRKNIFAEPLCNIKHVWEELSQCELVLHRTYLLGQHLAHSSSTLCLIHGSVGIELYQSIFRGWLGMRSLHTDEPDPRSFRVILTLSPSDNPGNSSSNAPYISFKAIMLSW